MKSVDYARMRKQVLCHDRGHDFKRTPGKGPADIRTYKCKCGAVAISTEGKLIVQPARPIVKEDRGK